MDNWNKEILRLATPSIISNVTVPLLGLVDLAVVGHIGNETYISAIAVGSMIFNVIYWLLGFLRMGTSGMTSQAYGRQDAQECLNILIRTLMIGVGVGIVFVIAQRGIEWGMLRLMNTPKVSWHYVAIYFSYLGCSCYVRTLWVDRMVYWDAGYAYTDDGGSTTKCR